MQANSVEKKLGYVFKDKSLLRTALTHGSYAHLHGGVSYDRMEYLGDALVDFIVAEELYRRHPDADEGELRLSPNSRLPRRRAVSNSRTRLRCSRITWARIRCCRTSLSR